MSTFRAMGDVARALKSSVASDSSFRSVSTRVLLRTGVSILEPRPDQVRDPVAIDKVMNALVSMGYAL